MAKSAKKSNRPVTPRAAVSAETLASLLARLRDLPAAAGTDEVQAAVGDAAPAVPAAARELGRSGDDPAIAALAALLTVPDFALPAVEALGHVRDAAAVQILQQVAAAPPSKDAGKAARRALHTLSSTGMTVKLPPPGDGRAVFQPLPAEGVAWSGALAGPIDADGSRSILLGQKRLPTGAASAIGVASESGGILFFQAAPQTHRQLDKEWQIFLDERPETLACEIPFDYAQWLLGEAADRMTEDGLEVPEEYTAWLEFSGGRPADVSPLQIYAAAAVDLAPASSVSATRAVALLEEPEIEAWTLPFEAMSSYGADLLSARSSPIVLSESAGLGRERQLGARAADEQFTGEMRRRYKRRLEETALLFQRSDRAEQARAALATALALGDDAVSPSEIPFAMALTLRAIETAAEIEAPATGEGQEARTLLYGADKGQGGDSAPSDV